MIWVKFIKIIYWSNNCCNNIREGLYSGLNVPNSSELNNSCLFVVLPAWSVPCCDVRTRGGRRRRGGPTCAAPRPEPESSSAADRLFLEHGTETVKWSMKRDIRICRPNERAVEYSTSCPPRSLTQVYEGLYKSDRIPEPPEPKFTVRMTTQTK